MTTWTSSRRTLEAAGPASALASKEKSWFKRVDRGQRLGEFILGGPRRGTWGQSDQTIYALKATVLATTSPLAKAGPKTARAPSGPEAGAAQCRWLS